MTSIGPESKGAAKAAALAAWTRSGSLTKAAFDGPAWEARSKDDISQVEQPD